MLYYPHGRHKIANTHRSFTAACERKQLMLCFNMPEASQNMLRPLPLNLVPRLFPLSEERPWFRLVTCFPKSGKLQNRKPREGPLSRKFALLSPLGNGTYLQKYNTSVCLAVRNPNQLGRSNVTYSDTEKGLRSDK